MAVLDESKESFIVNVPCVDEVETQLRDEERKRTGRYLAVTAVLIIIGIGLYHTVPKITSKITALVCAPVILLLYLLWLLYASQKRKHQLKRADLTVEKHVLENLNNIKIGPHKNYVYSSSEDETANKQATKEAKLKNENVTNNNENNINCEAEMEHSEAYSSSRKSSGSSAILIRTYSVA